MSDMEFSRRGFIGGAAAFFIVGCKPGGWLVGTPRLRFGVVSDIHITTQKSCAMTERAFRYFKSRGADAVMIPGDLTDWGLRSGIEYIKSTWDKVFSGTDVVPLFCTGNHDFDGWSYGDMTMEMHANGYSEDEALARIGLAEEWERIFGEKYAPIRVRTVKGYDFVSAEWDSFKKFPEWMAANGGRFKNGRPFFYFQHPPARGTTADSGGWDDKGAAFAALKGFPNAFAFTGHTHRPFNDERSIWQGEFTAIATPSLSYAGFPPGHENGSGKRDGTSVQAMPVIPYRRDLRGGQGFFVSVYDDCMVVERIDIEEECAEGAPAWIVPLSGGEKPYDFASRAEASVAPEFPSGAKLRLDTRNTENRSGKWVIVMNCEFPSAVPPAGGRVFDYEIRIVPKDGSEPMAKKFLSPAYSRMAKHEPKMQRFWFDVAELPQDVDYVVEVRAFNCFGKASRPLVSGVWHSVPGLDKVKKDQGEGEAL